MSLLDYLLSYSGKNYTNQKGFSLNIRNSRLLQDSQQSQQEISRNQKSRMNALSLQKSKKQNETIKKNNLKFNQSVVLYKLTHLIEKKIKVLRYLFWVKLETLRKCQIQKQKQEKMLQLEQNKKNMEDPLLANDSKNLQKILQISQMNIQKIKTKINNPTSLQFIKRLNDSLQFLIQKQFDNKNKSITFSKIKKYANCRHNLLNFITKAVNLIKFKETQNQETIFKKLKSIDKLYSKIQIFTDVFSSFYRKYKIQTLQNTFNIIIQEHKKNTMKKFKLSQSRIIKEKPNLVHQQLYQKTIPNFEINSKHSQNNFVQISDLNRNQSFTEEFSTSTPLIIKISQLLEKPINSQAKMNTQKLPVILHRLYPDQISKEVQDISDNVKFVFSHFQSNYTVDNFQNTFDNHSMSNANFMLNNSITSSITNQMKLETLMYQIQQLKQKEQKFHNEIKQLNLDQFSSAKAIHQNNYLDSLQFKLKDNSREVTPQSKKYRSNIVSANSSTQKNTPFTMSMKINKNVENSSDSKKYISRKIKQSCIDVKTIQQNKIKRLNINLNKMFVPTNQQKLSFISDKTKLIKNVNSTTERDCRYIDLSISNNNLTSRRNDVIKGQLSNKKISRIEQIKPTNYPTNSLTNIQAPFFKGAKKINYPY